jgi:hypothetical protein
MSISHRAGPLPAAAGAFCQYVETINIFVALRDQGHWRLDCLSHRGRMCSAKFGAGTIRAAISARMKNRSHRCLAVTLIEAVLFISTTLSAIVGGLVFCQQPSTAQRASARGRYPAYIFKHCYLSVCLLAATS